MVPQLWHLEIGNVLTQAERRGRISAGGMAARIELLRRFLITTDDATVVEIHGCAEGVHPGARCRRAAGGGDPLQGWDQPGGLRQLEAAVESPVEAGTGGVNTYSSFNPSPSAKKTA